MEYDFAIIYFGLTRSVRKTHETHKKYVFDVLQKNKLTYKTFIHTWKTKDDTQNVWEHKIPHKIDYLEYKLLSPDFYKLDDEDEFIESICMDDYFYKDASVEWLPIMILNYLCMLQSQKRGLDMVKERVLNGDKFKFIMFIRPDVTIVNELPVDSIVQNEEKIHIPNHGHFYGISDQFAIINYKNSDIYGSRFDNIADYRKNQGRIVAEQYCRYVIQKHKLEINSIDFKFSITRP
jgi:hypothetical protein